MFGVKRKVYLVAIGLFLAFSVSACQTINLNCPGGGGPTGAAGCANRLQPATSSDIVNGQPCSAGGTICMNAGKQCDPVANPTWTCQNTNTSGFCQCKCQL